MLGVMAEISMDLVANIAITDAVSNIASALIGGNVGGIMQTVTQQLGLGPDALYPTNHRTAYGRCLV